jgi:hypothetical protein
MGAIPFIRLGRRRQLENVRRRYQIARQQPVGTLPPHFTAQIMVTSERLLGKVGGLTTAMALASSG